jgi:hypothetical protein
MQSWECALMKGVCAKKTEIATTKPKDIFLKKSKRTRGRRCEASGASGFMELRAPEVVLLDC